MESPGKGNTGVLWIEHFRVQGIGKDGNVMLLGSDLQTIASLEGKFWSQAHRRNKYTELKLLPTSALYSMKFTRLVCCRKTVIMNPSSVHPVHPVSQSDSLTLAVRRRTHPTCSRCVHSAISLTQMSGLPNTHSSSPGRALLMLCTWTPTSLPL